MLRKFLVPFALLWLLLVLLIGLPASAANLENGSSHQQVIATTEYILGLPLPTVDFESVPTGALPEQGKAYAYQLIEQQAQPLLHELAQLREQGHITDFAVQPEKMGIVVQVKKEEESLQAVSELMGIAYIAAADTTPSACTQGASEALIEQVDALRQIKLSREHTINARTTTTNPSILIYHSPDSTYGYISGSTDAYVYVTVNIIRNGRVITTQIDYSDSTGYYYLYPSYQTCPSQGYNWTIKAGDIVEVTANGNTASTVVVDISASVDPVTNVVAGTTASDRLVEIEVGKYQEDLCYGNYFSQLVGTNGGNFSADFTNQVDFDRMSWAYIYAWDANGNGTYTNFYAYRISSYFNTSTFWGYLKPNTAFTASLIRGGNTLSTVSGTASATNYYFGNFSQTIQNGDMIEVDGGGVHISYTATSLSVNFNTATDQVTGITGANRRVWANFNKRSSGNVVNGCSSGYACDSTTANGAGTYTLYSTGMDFTRGDYAYFYVVDSSGNYQYAYSISAAAIVVNLTYGEVRGYWQTNGISGVYLTIVHKESDGTILNTYTNVYASNNGSFSRYLSTWPIATDKIEVTDGVTTQIMTVQNVTGRLDGGSQSVSGTAYNGKLLAYLYDFQRTYGNTSTYCQEMNVSGGAYNMSFSGAQIGPQDGSEIYNTGPDGHYTVRFSEAFTINVNKNNDFVTGVSETPYAQVTITLWRGGSPIDSAVVNASVGGYFYVFLGTTILQGDVVQVQTNDGDTGTVTVPTLTVTADVGSNAVTGQSPANQPIRIEARRHYYAGYYDYWYSTRTADGNGLFSFPLDGLTWWNDCSAVAAGHVCFQPAVRYFDANSHQIWFDGNYPATVPADGYESDNSYATAIPYIGPQTHSFHIDSDEDWVSFTVYADTVGQPYYIDTLNLGWEMGTRVQLYASNGTTLLTESTGYSNGGYGDRLIWTPGAVGTYYVRVVPPSSYDAGNCDSVYDLRIATRRLYLPLLPRS